MGLINVTQKSITWRHAQLARNQRQTSRLILSVPERYFIKCCGLDHSGSEPFNYKSNALSPELPEL